MQTLVHHALSHSITKANLLIGNYLTLNLFWVETNLKKHAHEQRDGKTKQMSQVRF